MAYKTFIRSATCFGSFGKARKTTRHTGKSYSEAQELCDSYNNNRTKAQRTKGTMMEFTKE